MSLWSDRIPVELAARLATNPFRRPNHYTIRGNVRLLDMTVCKRCGEVLTAMYPDPRVPEATRELRDVEVRTIIIERYVSRQPLEAYTTLNLVVEEPMHVPFELSEGETRDPQDPQQGLHHTALCKTCKKALIADPDPVVLQQLYDADLERMALEDEMRDKPVEHTLSLLNHLDRRKVVGIA